MKKKLDIPMFGEVTAGTQAHNHPEGNAFYKNLVEIVSPEYDAISANGTGLVLGATNDLPIPILNNGGANSYLTYETDDGVVQIGNAVDGGSSEDFVVNGDFSDGDTGWIDSRATVDYSSETALITNTDVGDIYGAMYQIGTTMKAGKTYIASINVLSMDGDRIRYTDSESNLVDITSLGITTFIVEATADITQINYRTYGVNGDVFELDDISIKEILPNSTTYTLVDDTYRWAYINENPFSEADLTAIAEEPNRIVEFAMDGTGLTNTQGVDDKFYGFRENSGATVYDALGVETADITSYAESIRISTANSQTSIQWTCAELDGGGVPTAYNSTQNTAIMHSDTSISTGFKPSIARYSIEEIVTGNLAVLDVNGDPTGSFTQRTEVRLLTHTDAIPETKYYINGIEQAVTPPLPDPAVIINLNDTAVIGYPDTIQSRAADFNVHSEIIVP